MEERERGFVAGANCSQAVDHYGGGALPFRAGCFFRPKKEVPYALPFWFGFIPSP
jgi:hypothetical protein